MSDESRPRPYGLLGLALSLPAIAFLSALYAALLAALVGLAATLVVGSGRSLAAWRAAQAAFRGGRLQGMLPELFALGVIVYVGLFAAVVTAAVWRAGGRWRQIVAWLPWSAREADRSYWLLLAFGVLYGLLASVGLGLLHVQAADQAALPKGPAGIAIAYVLIALAAPIAEETLFRGWIFTSLRSRLSFWPANSVSAALFAVAHWERTHLYALAVFPLGLMLGRARESGGSVKASAVFHGLYNGLALTLSLLVPF